MPSSSELARALGLLGAAGLLFAALPALADEPARPPHPDPRVIVSVTKVRGPHDRSAVERELRRALWGKIIACYKPGARKNQKLSGKARVRLDVTHRGKVKWTKLLGASLKDRKVARCMAKTPRPLKLPAAKRASTVFVEMYVAPGDEPVR